MLVIDPAKRITVEDALAHPFLSEFHEPDDEPTTEKLSQFDWNVSKTAEAIGIQRSHLYNKMNKYGIER